MIVVLAVLGMVGGLVLTRGPPRIAALEMRAAANTVAQSLRVARTRAIMSNQRVMVALDPRARTLRIGVGAPRGLPADIAMAVITTADLASAQPGAGGPAAIAFLPDGSSSGGRVELQAGTQHMQVGVDWLTGRVSVANGP